MKKYEHIPFGCIDIDGGFWEQKQNMVRNISVNNVYKRFEETGRFDAFKFEWKEGMPNQPHIFWDSDIAKWIESAAYLIEKKPAPELEEIVDRVVDLIEEHQDETGYFNIYFTVVEPQSRFQRREDHELYCAGHLFEAAVAYKNATGKDKFLRLMCKYADYIYKVFYEDKSAAFQTPGHEEIELALVKLHEATGNEKYLTLSKYFIDERGKREEGKYNWATSRYFQSHLPVREQTTAEGHSVRATYLYSGMADIARIYDDKELYAACRKLFDNIVNCRMYVTGGIGSTANGEAFTIDYDLPNREAYTETCAGIGLAFFARRMYEHEPDAVYADTVERTMYNGILSGISLDGKSFFYENPLEIIPALHHREVSTNGYSRYPAMQRSEVFGCSCCPPNITRFIASIGDFIYTKSEDTVYCHQYINSTAEFEVGGRKIGFKTTTDYPYDGRVEIKYTAADGAPIKAAFRIPGWCESYTVKVNGSVANGVIEKNYLYIELSADSSIIFDFDMPVRFIEADPRVYTDAGRYAVARGPIIYCMEAVDNGENLRDVRLDESVPFEIVPNAEYGNSLTVTAYRRDIGAAKALYSKKHDSLTAFKAKLIPYFAFANRGVSEMIVWILVH